MKSTKKAESVREIGNPVSHPHIATSFQARGSKSSIWNATCARVRALSW
jgi:hypothetical protein